MADAFDIRKFVKDAEKDGEIAQASYNVTNRMVAVLGDIPFRELFSEPWESLAPRLKENARAAMERDNAGAVREDWRVMPRGEEVAGRLDALAGFAGFTSADFVAPAPLDRQKEAEEIVVDLRRFGVYLPSPASCCCDTHKREVAVELLLAHAPDLTYRDLFERPFSELSVLQRFALEYAVETNTLMLARNQKCCFTDSGGNRSCVPGVANDNCYDIPTPCSGFYTTCGGGIEDKHD